MFQVTRFVRNLQIKTLYSNFFSSFVIACNEKILILVCGLPVGKLGYIVVCLVENDYVKLY